METIVDAPVYLLLAQVVAPYNSPQGDGNWVSMSRDSLKLAGSHLIIPRKGMETFPAP